MSLKTTRKFVKGPLAGTRLEIVPLKPAKTLPNGTPIVKQKLAILNTTQLAHQRGHVDVHEPQRYTIKEKTKATNFVGPSIAQEWKILYQGKRPFYQVESVDPVKESKA